MVYHKVIALVANCRLQNYLHYSMSKIKDVAVKRVLYYKRFSGFGVDLYLKTYIDDITYGGAKI